MTTPRVTEVPVEQHGCEPCVCAGTGYHVGQGIVSCDECDPTWPGTADVEPIASDRDDCGPDGF